MTKEILLSPLALLVKVTQTPLTPNETGHINRTLRTLVDFSKEETMLHLVNGGNFDFAAMLARGEDVSHLLNLKIL